MASKAIYEENKSLLKNFSFKELKELNKIEQEAIANYSGDLSTLASALGYLRIGYEVGWRVLFIVYHNSTIKKYDKILSINSKEFFPEEGPGSKRNRGLRIAKTLGKFWDVVRGQEKIENKRDFS